MDDEVQARIEAMTWFHALRLGRFSTPGRGGFPPNWSLLATLKLIEDIQLAGAHCADIDTQDGLAAFALAERGAGRVDATDLHHRPQFLLARELAGLEARVHYHADTHLNDLEDRWGLAKLDVLVLAGALYNSPSPLTALFKCRRLLKPDGLIIVETGCHPIDEPVLVVNTEHEEPRFDEATSFLVPSRRAVEGLLRLASFEVVASYDFEGRSRTTFLAKAVQPAAVTNRTPLLEKAHEWLARSKSDRRAEGLVFDDVVHGSYVASSVRYLGPTGAQTLDVVRYRPMIRFQPAYAAEPSPIAHQGRSWRARLAPVKAFMRAFRERLRA